MKTKPAVVLVVVIALVAAGLWGYPRWTRAKEPVLSGTIESRDVQVGSLVGGRVAAVHVDEGASVHAGDPIVTLEPDLLDLQLKEQQTVVDQSRARLNLTLAGPRIEARNQARADWENAERERQRLEGLLKHGLIPQEQYDNSATAARIKKEALQEAERGSRKEDIDAARANLAQAEARLAYLQRQRQETVVTAPADGVIQSFDLRPGDLVGANQPVATLLERDQLWVRVYVPETRLGLVHKGQTATIRVDTFPNRTFPGNVVEIRDRGEYTPRNVQTVEQRSDLVFGVKVAIDPTPELKPGMAALVTLQPPEAAR
jgi:multidrug resistance efflux pump